MGAKAKAVLVLALCLCLALVRGDDPQHVLFPGGLGDLVGEEARIVNRKLQDLEQHAAAGTMKGIVEGLRFPPITVLVESSMLALARVHLEAILVQAPIDYLVKCIIFDATDMVVIKKHPQDLILELRKREELGAARSDSASLRRAIGSAIDIADENGVVLVFTMQTLSNRQLSEGQIQAMLRKRVKIFVVPSMSYIEQDSALHHLTAISGGMYFGNESTEVLFLSNGMSGRQVVRLPLDFSVRSLLIEYSTPVERAELWTPQRQGVDLTNATAVQLFSAGSTVQRGPEKTSLEVRTSGAEAAGPWFIAMEGDRYSLKVAATFAGLGPVSHQEAAHLVDEAVPQNGSDSSQMAKISYYNDRSLSSQDQFQYMYQYQPLDIVVSSRSTLIVAPGNSAQIYFDVTNNKATKTTVYLSARDEKALLSDINPKVLNLAPHQTASVAVMMVRAREDSIVDTVTLIASSPERTEKSAMVYVTSRNPTDTDGPDIDYYFLSSCMDVLVGPCELGAWTLEVTARDTRSGLLHVVTEPAGLLVPDGYTAGTKETVRGYLHGSCCNAEVRITALDLRNNRRQDTANGYRAAIGAAAIAAIILGILLFIIIILAIALVIKHKVAKRMSNDIPTYRTNQSRI